MDVFDAVRTVLAVRAFQDKPVPAEIIGRIVEAGRLTASSQNGQPWHFIVVTDRDTVVKFGEIARTGRYTAQAAFAIVVAIERTPYAVSDGSRAIQSMILTAWADGIGSNWVGFGKMPAVNPLLDIPADLDVLAILPFGYPVKAIGQGKKNRKPASQVIHHGKFGQP